MKRYADSGGKVFAEHLHSYWIHKGLPPWPATGAWAQSVLPDLADPSKKEPDPPLAVYVDTTFPKGIAMADWLVTTKASTTRGQILAASVQNSIDSVNPPAQQWLHTTSPKATTQYMSFNTPVEAPAANQCGSVTFTDVHVAERRQLAPRYAPSRWAARRRRR